MTGKPQQASPDQPQRIAIYTRISADNSGRAVGVTDQAKQCREKIAREFPAAVIVTPGCQCAECARDGAPPDVYCDNDLSADGQKHRPHYDRLVADIGAGLVDAVVTVDTDRLYRNMRQLEGYIDACEPRKVDTHTVKAGRFDLSNPSGRAFARMGGVMATYELEQMILRQRQAKRRSREDGLRCAGPRPYGYRITARGADGKGLAVVEEEAAFIRQGCTDLLAGLSLNEIVKKWNAAGARTTGAKVAGGDLWKHTTLRNVLLHATNAALIEHPSAPYGKGEIIGPGRWEPIIGEETYFAVRALLTDKSRQTGPGPRPRSLLSGVLVCGLCGHRSFRVNHKNWELKSGATGRTATYRCDSGADPGNPWRVAHLSRNAGPLDAHVTGEVLGILGDESALSALVSRPAADITTLVARRISLEKDIAEWEELARSKEISPREFVRITKPIKADLKQAEQAEIAARIAPGLDEFADGRDPSRVWAGLSLERKRAVTAMLLRVLLLPTGPGGGVHRKGVNAHARMTAPIDLKYVVILPPDDGSIPEWWASVEADRRREIASMLPAGRDFLKDLTV